MTHENNLSKLFREYNIEYAEENAEGEATFFGRDGDKELKRKVYKSKSKKYVIFFGSRWFLE